jgi:hypothetical protein
LIRVNKEREDEQSRAEQSRAEERDVIGLKWGFFFEQRWLYWEAEVGTITLWELIEKNWGMSQVRLNCVITLHRLSWSVQNWVWFRVLSNKCFHLAAITRASSVLKRLRVSQSDRVLPSNLALFLRIQMTLRTAAIAWRWSSGFLRLGWRGRMDGGDHCRGLPNQLMNMGCKVFVTCWGEVHSKNMWRVDSGCWQKGQSAAGWDPLTIGRHLA